MPNDEDDDIKTPTATPVAKKHPSSARHFATKPCPECLGDESRALDCHICDNQRFTNEPVKYSTWDLRKTLADYNKGE